MENQNLKWELVGHVLVVVTGHGPIPEPVWNSFYDALSTLPFTKYLGVSIGSIEMTSLQRKLGAETVKRRRISAAIVTDMRLVRGIVTAVSWLGADVKAFSMTELKAAFAFLSVPEDAQDRVMASVDRLKRQISS